MSKLEMQPYAHLKSLLAYAWGTHWYVFCRGIYVTSIWCGLKWKTTEKGKAIYTRTCISNSQITYLVHTSHVASEYRIRPTKSPDAHYFVMGSCRKCWRERCSYMQVDVPADKRYKRFWFPLTSRCVSTIGGFTVVLGVVVLMGAFVGIVARAGAFVWIVPDKPQPTLRWVQFVAEWEEKIWTGPQITRPLLDFLEVVYKYDPPSEQR